MIYNPFLPNLINCLLLLFTAVFSTYALGRLILIGVPKLRNSATKTETIFNSLTLGFIALVSFYAIVWTKGNSIFLLLIFIVFFYILHPENNRRLVILNQNRFSFSELKVFLFILILFILSFFFLYFLYFVRGAGEIWTDYLFYSNVSNALLVSHVESGSPFIGAEAAHMYHFVELWFNSFWSSLFHENRLHVLLLVTYSYFLTLCLLGSYLIARLFVSGKYLPVFLSVIFLLYKPIVAVFIPFVDPVFSNPKVFALMVLLLFSCFQYLKRNYTLAFSILLLVVPFYSTMAPGILSGLFIMEVIRRYKENGFSIKTIINYNTLMCIAVFAFFVVFYYLQTKFHSRTDISQTTVLYDHPIKRALLFTIKRTSRGLVLFLPIILVFGFLKFKTKEFSANEQYSLFIFALTGIFMSSIVGGFAANYILDGGQICTNFTDTVVDLVLFVCLVYLLSFIEIKKTYPVVIFILGLYLFLFTYKGLPLPYPEVLNGQQDEMEFYTKLKPELHLITNNGFAYFRNYEIPEHRNSQYDRLMTVLPLNKIAYIVSNGYYAPYCLSVFDIPNDTDPIFDERTKSDFWKYTQLKRKEQPLITLEDCTLLFIREKCIKYLIVESKAQLPKYLIGRSNMLGELKGDRIYKVTPIE